ncbi:hypothetical protein K450DRAFT_250377 [Umbelopsis ramanniana AG]|uniref:Uncharacterized protein n=1 Tax=Umbelopsis ramanniana AG TaxID=1314678 RepID=A0AAD5E7Q7_UMBRA|nr:uncharacterized protein K450DRAFT_250377 [Umbelopsis ramanniana AG]KAI8577850.1 hypothetical protein K450DRAFT_250377 [Umbelopsis ramanniana AG]
MRKAKMVKNMLILTIVQILIMMPKYRKLRKSQEQLNENHQVVAKTKIAPLPRMMNQVVGLIKFVAKLIDMFYLYVKCNLYYWCIKLSE